MARPKKEINPIRAQRLNEIMTDEGINQRELSKRLNLSQQSISRILNGAATLTETTANRIIFEFPKYRFEWIMGYDDFKTVKDKDEWISNIIQDRDHDIISDVTNLLFFRGVLVNKGSIDYTVKFDEISDALSVRIMDSDEIHFITKENLLVISNDVADYAKFRLMTKLIGGSSDGQ